MEFALPEIGEGVYEAELVRWLVAPGDAVRPGQPLLEVMTDKATSEVPAPFAGTVAEVLGQPGSQVKVGDVILRYSGTQAARPAEPKAAAAPPLNGTPSPTPLAVRASPSVRQMARKLGVDLGAVRGSGPEGRVLIGDLSARLAPPPAPKGDTPADVGKAGTRVKLVGLRRKIAEHMVHAKRTIPHYSYIDECDVTALVALRDSLKEPYQAAGVRLTYLAFIVKAVALSLREVPLVNASLDEAAAEIVMHAGVHVGVAVATPAGLLVPVVRDADRKDVGTIAREIGRLADDARAGRPKLDDVRGGTFTVTSIGGIGGLISTPVINHPEVGIVGIGKVVRRPVYDERDQIRPAWLLYLSFSFDHRVVDGAVGALFGNAVARRLRNPAALLLPERL